MHEGELLMPLFDDLETEEQIPEKEGAWKYLGLIIFACTLPVVFLVWVFGTRDMGLNAGICLGMNTFAVGLCWDLRKHWWFWCLVIFMLALNAPLVAMIHWPRGWVPPIVLLPLGLADMMATVGVVRLVEKFIVKSSPTDGEE
jgi:hypothetical protein